MIKTGTQSKINTKSIHTLLGAICNQEPDDFTLGKTEDPVNF